MVSYQQEGRLRYDQYPLSALRCIFVPHILYTLLPVLRQGAGLELTAQRIHPERSVSHEAG